MCLLVETGNHMLFNLFMSEHPHKFVADLKNAIFQNP